MTAGELGPARPMAGFTLRSVALSITLIVALFGAISLWRAIRFAPVAVPPPPPLPVALATVEPSDVPLSIDAVGSLRAVQEVTLAPEVAGRVTAITFTAGQTVSAGTLLVQLFDAPEQADRAQARSRAAFAALQQGRSKQLATLGADTRERLDQRRADLDQANAAIEALDARIAQKQVRAPFSGSIGLRRVNLGQYLNPGDAIATLTALDTLFVDFTVPQQDLMKLHIGQGVTVATDAQPGRDFAAHVTAIEPRVGEDTRNVTIEATLANPDHALKPGMYVTASLNLPPAQGVLTVPITAIQTSAAGESAIVVRGTDPKTGGTAEVVAVMTGQRFGGRVVVTEGLRPGDVVVTEGQLRVQPGAAVIAAATPGAPTTAGAR